MKEKPLSAARLASINLLRRPFRPFCLALAVAALSFAVFGGALLAYSLQRGFGSMESRLGADIIAVPAGYEAGAEGVLLKGEPGYFYFDRSVAAKIAAIEGVEVVTPQFYLTSMTAECCSTKVQIIAFDPETDFVIQPWISQSFHGTLADGQVLAGSDIAMSGDGTVKFFTQRHVVAAKLAKTATGLDQSVFVSWNTMKSILNDAHGQGFRFIADAAFDTSISTVLVKLSEGADISAVKRRINDVLPDVGVISRTTMLSGVADSLGVLIPVILWLSVALWGVAAAVLAILFSISMNERKKEFAIYRILGAAHRWLARVILLESLAIGVLGGIAGVGLAALAVFPFSTYIADRIALPFLSPSAWISLGLATGSILIAVTAGMLVSACAAARVGKAEAYFVLKEGE